MYLRGRSALNIRDEFDRTAQSYGQHRKPVEEHAVSTPTVTEIVSRPEPVAHDPFIDDLRVALAQARRARAEKEPR
jgi:hypothetical protein